MEHEWCREGSVHRGEVQPGEGPAQPGEGREQYKRLLITEQINIIDKVVCENATYI